RSRSKLRTSMLPGIILLQDLCFSAIHRIRAKERYTRLQEDILRWSDRTSDTRLAPKASAFGNWNSFDMVSCDGSLRTRRDTGNLRSRATCRRADVTAG